MKNEQTPFNDETTFNDSLIELLTKLINEKLSKFLEFCIVTRNAEPLKEIINIINKHHFNE